MGAADSKQKLGERVIAARRKLEDDTRLQSERAEDLMAKSPKTMQFMLSSIQASFDKYAPFLEPTLLIAWKADSEKCKGIVVHACKKVLSAPIQPDEYDWFKQYVLPSSIWMMKTKDDRFMFQELMEITQSMSLDIIQSMDSVYAHLRKHDKWNELLAIKEETLVSRQDDKKVGLLQDKGIRDMTDIKDDDEKMSQLQTFIDAHAAINSLTVSAKTIDREFQNYVKTMMGRYGSFKSAPMKKVERCLSKLENDYQSAQYPKSAKLLDLVRCSVTFNTLEQLIQGFNAVKDHVDSPQKTMKLARVKNGFLDSSYDGGYRDIKINVIFHSAMNPEIKMICEIQLILSQFLHEKKRIHKLYSIAREETYFQMVVSTPKAQNTTDVKQLKFEPVVNASKDVKGLGDVHGKCSIDSASGLLGIEDNNEQFRVYNMEQKKVVFEHPLSFPKWNEFQRQGYSHDWIQWRGKKHVSVQTEQHIIRTFAVDRGFAEVDSLRIALKDSDEINYCAFEKKSNRIFMVRNKKILEVRALRDVKQVAKSITLEQEIGTSNLNPLSLTQDGAWCAIGGGKNKNYFFLIDIAKGTQYKCVTSTLGNGHTMGGVIPCFINTSDGQAQFVAVGGAGGKFEVWNVQTRKASKFLSCKESGTINCLSSIGGILATGSNSNMLNLWDVGDWSMFYEKKCGVEPTSLHLSEDSKYLTVSGWNGEKCLVLKTNSV